MKKNRKGMSLAEVMVAIVIIGVALGVSAAAIKKIKANYTSLTYFAHKNVQALVTEMVSGKRNVEIVGAPDPVTGMITTEKMNATLYCKTETGKYETILKPDGYKNKAANTNCIDMGDSINTTPESDAIFCKFLGEYSSVAGNYDCTKLFEVGYIDDEPSIILEDEDKVVKPTFITTNGQAFYLSQWESNLNVSKDFGFRILAIDLNGKSLPNKYNSEDIPPDIVQFLILDNGEVFPLGVAADNFTSGGKTYNYLNSRWVAYYYRTNNLPAGIQVAPECKVELPNDKEGNERHNCDYKVKYSNFSSYRQAFCQSIDHAHTAYTEYCDKVTTSNECASSTTTQEKADLCMVKTVKPLFRFNFK